MSNPPADGGDWPTPDDRGGEHASREESGNRNGAITTSALLADARRRLRERPRALLALLVAGIVVALADWLLGHDPVPTVGFAGVLDGRFAVTIGIVVDVVSRARTPLSALIGLRPRWAAWTIGLELVTFLAVTGAGAYALARLLGVELTGRAMLRYTGVAALLGLVSANATLTGGAVVLAVVLVPLALVVLVRLFALPGLLVAGRSIRAAVRESWRRTRGHGWSILGVLVLVGFSNHLLASVPVAGPVGSALAGALHAGTVAVFLRASDGAGGAS